MPIATSSLGSSYFYPVTQSPFSSYKSVVLRGTSTPGVATGAGQLYVQSGSGDLYFLDQDGAQIVVASVAAGAGENVFENIIVSGTADIRGTIENGTGHLILSSSAGSVVAVSGALLVKAATQIYFSIGDV